MSNTQRLRGVPGGRQDHPDGIPRPGEKQAISVSMIGQPGGPWALITNDGGITIATGMGDATKITLLGLINLAAMAVAELPVAKQAEALDRAYAIIAAQAQGQRDRMAALDKLEVEQT